MWRKERQYIQYLRDRSRREQGLLHCAWYYDLSDRRILAGDPESSLCWLCDECAERFARWVRLAGEDDLVEQPCWACGRRREDDIADSDNLRFLQSELK